MKYFLVSYWRFVLRKQRGLRMLRRARVRIWADRESPWFLESNWEALGTLSEASWNVGDEIYAENANFNR